MTIAVFVLIGLAAGVLSGLFGIGGGVVIVPALAAFGRMSFTTATGTSLAALLLPVGLLGAMEYWKRGQVQPIPAALVALGLVLGAWVGARVVGGLLVTAVGYVLFALAGSLWVLLLARLVQGMGGGTIGVIHAYVTDVSAPEERTKTLGWLSAVTSLGAVAGPAIGAVLVEMGGVAFPGWAAAAFVTQRHRARKRADAERAEAARHREPASGASAE